MKGIRPALRTALVALIFCAAGAASAQQTTVSSRVLNFEILSVDGNQLVYRDQEGSHEISVPADFRFQVDGRALAVGELKPGMKGSATVTTATTVIPVYTLELRDAEVLSRVSRTVVVRGQDGQTRRFTQSQADEMGVRMYRDGKPIQIMSLNPGDHLSALLVSRDAPEVLTQQQVEATLEHPDEVAAPIATPVATVAAVAATAEKAAEAVGDVTTAAADTAVTAEASAAADQPAPASGDRWWVWVLLIAIVLALLILFTRKKDPARN